MSLTMRNPIRCPPTAVGVTVLGLLAALSGPLSLAMPVSAEPLSFDGMCDASAAVALDDTHFVVADDERDTLRVYALGTPGQVSELNLTNYLGNFNKKGEPKEGDIEGAARRGDKIVWITSHGRNKDGETKVFRFRLFETDIVGGVGVSQSTTPAYAGLHDDLLQYARLHPELGLAEAEPNPPKKGGLNIEGLADAGDDGLLIGFRSPLVNVDQRAIVLPLLGITPMLQGGGSAQFGEPVLLDLGKRGIRSMEKIGEQIFILAGPSAENNGDEGAELSFALYVWSGHKEDDPLQQELSFGDLNPEALFSIGTEIMALSDDGTVDVGGVDCKKAADAQKSFRALILGTH